MNTIGNLFRISIFGESHGKSVGILIDGCPPGIKITNEDFISDLSRRKSGAVGTTQRNESDIPIIKSGIFNDFTTGSPILIEFENIDTDSKVYNKNLPRPGHSDFTAFHKYKGFNDYRGGGHFSGRLTVGLVAAAVFAKKIISPINVYAKLIEAGGSTNIESVIDNAVQKNDSVGGVVECITSDLPIGLGEPFFNSIESLIAHYVFSIPAIIGLEFGIGFEAAKKNGSELIDSIIEQNGKKEFNFTGGINGGISNGNPLIFRVAVKPTSSIPFEQKTINTKTKETEVIKVIGRHDACIALRVPVVLEAVTAIVLADLLLLNK